jgi:hypothetical protein
MIMTCCDCELATCDHCYEDATGKQIDDTFRCETHGGPHIEPTDQVKLYGLPSRDKLKLYMNDDMRIYVPKTYQCYSLDRANVIFVDHHAYDTDTCQMLLKRLDNTLGVEYTSHAASGMTYPLSPRCRCLFYFPCYPQPELQDEVIKIFSRKHPELFIITFRVESLKIDACEILMPLCLAAVQLIVTHPSQVYVRIIEDLLGLVVYKPLILLNGIDQQAMRIKKEKQNERQRRCREKKKKAKEAQMNNL